jgi:hypothetical protein
VIRTEPSHTGPGQAGPAPAAVRAKVHDALPISVTGLFAVLLIFVLAQIFRCGSEMRAELAGTIKHGDRREPR